MRGTPSHTEYRGYWTNATTHSGGIVAIGNAAATLNHLKTDNTGAPNASDTHVVGRASGGNADADFAEKRADMIVTGTPCQFSDAGESTQYCVRSVF